MLRLLHHSSSCRPRKFLRTQVPTTIYHVFVRQCQEYGSYLRHHSTSEKRRLRPEDYSVGWVSALAIELAAAIEMLDEEHQDLPQRPEDANVYTLGKMGEHNVVIACLPEGQLGPGSAAVVAARMTAKFPCLRFGLMVGIGGGVPSKAVDVRLGDVVISKPNSQHGGVVQYDHGKSTVAGFERTGSLNTPPPLLLSAISKLEAQHHRGRGAMFSYLSRFDRIPGSKFAREQAGPDRLFKAVYSHVGALNCDECSEAELEKRPERADGDHIKVHYGTIASGNQVIKNGVMRDTVSSDLDGVLCFEMEAAGLMNSFPCLVIRGICDYADSHKNKTWQPFASATAAACAREILSVIPVSEVDATQVAQKVAKEIESPPDVLEGCFSVPYERNPRFVGHETPLASMESKIFGVEECHTVAITGLGGVGKTQVALELAYRLREKHTDCKIFWVSATSVENFERGYFRIGLHLRLPGIGDESVDVKSLIKDYLSQEQSGKWMLVLDGADDISTVFGTDGRHPFVRLVDFLPRSSRGVVIMTTRDRRIASRLAKRHTEEIPELSEQAAFQLLKSSLIHTEATDATEAAAILLRELAFLPLAIVQAAAYINENGQSISEYLSLLEDTGGNIIELLGESYEDERACQNHHAVATTWLLSFQQMQQRQPLAAKFLSFMACLDPWNIPQSLLPDAPSPKAAIEAVSALTAYSFITRRTGDPSLDQSRRQDPRISLQKLVHLATRNWLREEGTLSHWTEMATVKLAEIFKTLDVADRKATAIYLPHAQYLLGSKVPHDAVLKDADLRHKVGRCLMMEGKYEEAGDMFSHAVNTRNKLDLKDDPVTLSCMADLASAYREQGRWKEAESLGTEVVATQTKAFGEANSATLESMSGLAWTYGKQARWKEAEALGTRVMALQTELLGKQHPSTLDTAAHLARTYREQGNWKQAQVLAEQVAEVRAKLFPDDHPFVLDSLDLLASVYRRQGRYAEAEALGLRAVERQKNVLGHDHPSTLKSMANLSRTYREIGRWEEAEDLAVHVLDVRKATLGDEHPWTLAMMFQLAWIYRKQGRLIEAEDLGIRVREADTRLFGQEHPLTLNSIYGLSRTYTEQGRWEEAQNLGLQVLEVQSWVLGDDHPWTLSNMANIAIIYKKRGLLKEAENLAKYVLNIEKRVFGETHPWTLNNVETLATVYKHRENYTEARRLGSEVLHARERVLGADNMFTRRSREFVASLYQQT